MKRRTVTIVILLLMSVACSLPIAREAPERREFVLDVSRSPGQKAGPSIGVLRVNEFRVPQQYEGRGFKYRLDDLTFQSDFYNEFFTLPGQMIAEQTRRWLADSGIFKGVDGATEDLQSSYILDGTIQELYGDYRFAEPRGVMAIDFVLLEDVKGRRKVVFNNSYKQEWPASGRSAKELARAWNDALFSILQAFEKDLQAKLGRTSGS